MYILFALTTVVFTIILIFNKYSFGDISNIHSKSEKVCGVCFLVTKNVAEKVRKS